MPVALAIKSLKAGGERAMANLMISAEPDEMQSLRAVAVVQAAAAGQEVDLAATAQELLRGALASKLAELGLRWNPSPEAVERHTSRAARPDGPVARLMKTDRARRYATSALAVAVLILLWGGYGQGWAWTGFQGNNQLWDWLHLLLLPVVVGTLPLWIQHPEYMSPTRRMAYLAAGAAFVALVVAGYLVPLNWTGFPGNTLWDWLELVLLPIAVISAPFLLSVLHSLRPHHQWAIASVAVAWALTVIGGYTWGWTWTGYQGNTFWDWLGLLLLPLLVPTVLLSTALRWVSGNTPNATHEGGTKAPRAAGNTATAR
jgi:hypothetical protein